MERWSKRLRGDQNVKRRVDNMVKINKLTEMSKALLTPEEVKLMAKISMRAKKIRALQDDPKEFAKYDIQDIQNRVARIQAKRAKAVTPTSRFKMKKTGSQPIDPFFTSTLAALDKALKHAKEIADEEERLSRKK